MARFWDFPEAFLDRPLVLDGDAGTLTYRAMDAEARLWQNRIIALAGGETPLLVLEFDTSAEAIAAYLGALRTGWPLLVLEPGQMAPDSPITQHYHPDIVLSRRESGFAARRTRMPMEGTEQPHPDLALLLSTSGSTGDPKLVRLSAENIDSNAQAIAEYLSLTPDDRAMTTLPLFYSYGLSVLNSYLAAGGSLVLTRHSVVEPGFWEDFRAGGATSLALVPHQFELLDRSPMAALEERGLRYVTQAGGRLSPDLVRRFAGRGKAAGWQLFLMYGQTEAAPRISYVPPDALPGAADTIGRPIPGGRLRVFDGEREILHPGEEGELVYDGPNVMMGYAAARKDLARGPEVTELRTGDMAQMTGDGFFRITGRLKRFVKLFGLRLSLDRIEALLREKGIVAHAVAHQDQLVLLLPGNQGAAGQEAARRVVAAEYQLPPSVVHTHPLVEVPLLPSGKIDQRALTRIAAEALEQMTTAGGVNDIAELLRQATRAPHVAGQDSFTSLGGDSLGYLQVQMGLEQMLGQAPDGWENMTLAELEALAPQTKRGWGTVGVDVVLRVVAISLVVAEHASNLPLYGGVWMLILLMGHSAGRFQTRTIVEGHWTRLIVKMLYPILPLYALLALAYAIINPTETPLSFFFLLGNFHPARGGFLLGVYWFISLYVQIVLIMAAVAAVPWLRERLAAGPWKAVAKALFALLVLVGGMSLLPGYMDDTHRVVFPVSYITTRGLLECLPIFLTGWVIQAAETPREKAVTLLLSVGVAGVFLHLSGSPGATAWLVAALLLLAIAPRSPSPMWGEGSCRRSRQSRFSSICCIRSSSMRCFMRRRSSGLSTSL
ncbi:AMP-binding protein [Haematobacter missouriensis]|nr:AMP-binding protein [Haematobacter missouriensis]